LAGIGRWLHTLGYRGHVTTKSRRYSVTMGALRAIRATWARQQAGKDCSPQHHSPLDLTEQSDDVWWEFDHAGHATPGDRTLVYSAALQNILTRRTGLVEARAKPAMSNGIRQGDAMADKSRTPHARSGRGARTDAPTMSEGGVEIDLPDHYRLPREANRALVQAILAVRDRMLGSDRGVA
jgi:hypothetical protein